MTESVGRDSEPSAEVLLGGLCGDNPLAFLSAIGTLRVLARCWHDRRMTMSWVFVGSWKPVLHVAGGCQRTDVVAALYTSLTGRDTAPEFTLVPDGKSNSPREITMAPDEFRAIARLAAAQTDRTLADFCSAYGTEAFAEDSIRDTALRFTSGQQSFLGSIRELAAAPPEPPRDKKRPSKTSEGSGTTADHLDHALFERWSYADPRPSLRWDPLDDRRYALRAHNPTDPSVSPILTVRGANRLAFEALPWLPTFPCRGDAQTLGFRWRSRELDFSWPIWEPHLSPIAVRTMLGMRDLVDDAPDPQKLKPRGIAQVYRARRIGSYYRNFAPARPCWAQDLSVAGFKRSAGHA